MKNILAIIAFIAMIGFWLFISFRVYISYQQDAHIESLEAQIKYVIVKHNNFNHELIKLRERNEELSDSNMALIKVCNPT